MLSLRRAAGGAGLTLLLAAALVCAPAFAAQVAAPSHPFLFSLEGFFEGRTPIPPPAGELEDACGVAVDSAGDIYLSDYYHRTIDVYTPTRSYLTQIADPDPDGPCNLAVDSAGNVYVNNWHRDVVRFTASEYPPTEATVYGSATPIDFPSSPGARSTGVFLDPATGDLYVDDRTYVAEYEPSGALIRRIGEGSLGQGYGVAVSDFPATAGHLYVPDATTNTVKVYGQTGALVEEIDGAGTPQRGFASLADSNVVVDDATGHIYVADNTEPGFEHPKGVVDEFNSEGHYRGQLPRAIVDAEPIALALDAAGSVYATSGNDEEAALYAFGPTFPAHGLEVAKTGAGEGTVTSEPAGINCGEACAAEYNAGEEVILIAVPAPGSEFAGWTGGGCSLSRTCHLTVAADTGVSAEFEALPPQPLSLQGPGAPSTAAAIVAPAGAASFAGSPATRALARHHRHRRPSHRGRHGKERPGGH